MVRLVQLMLNWMLLSALYSIIAIGFTLIFGVGNQLNLFHGASITMGAYTTHLVSAAGYPAAAALFVGMLVPGIVNGALYLGVINSIKDRPIAVLMITLLLAIIFEEAITFVLGPNPVPVPALIDEIAVLFSNRVQLNRLAVVFISLGVIAALMYVFRYTWTGKAILATSQDNKGAALSGINGNRMLLLVWVLAGLLAGIAGGFLGAFLTASPTMGFDPLILSFSIVILGGLGSIKGSILGAYLIGGAETLMTSLVSPRFSGFPALILLIVVLLVRPQGLFGRAEIEGGG